MTALSRRELLIGSAATLALASCDKPVATTGGMFDHLRRSGVEFIDKNGALVNLNATETGLRGKPTTLSFMFANCGDVCPLTASTLNHVSQSYPSLQHVVISVDPFNDYSTGLLASTLAAQGLIVDGPRKNTTILYPSIDGTDRVESLATQEAAVKIQHDYELVTSGQKVEGHSGVITLFGADGKSIAQTVANEPGPLLDALSNQSIAR